MPIVVTFELNFKDEAVSDAIGWFNSDEGLAATREKEGCLGAEMHQNQEDGNQVLLIERWETKENFDAYMQWRTERGDLENMVNMVTSPPIPKFWTHVG